MGCLGNMDISPRKVQQIAWAECQLVQQLARWDGSDLLEVQLRVVAVIMRLVVDEKRYVHLVVDTDADLLFRRGRHQLQA